LEKQMNLRQSILDALVDDSESIVQIKNYLKYYNVSYTDVLLKEIIIRLLDESLIKIIYPPNSNAMDIVKADSHTITDYWFKLTEKGYKEWNNIPQNGLEL